MSTLPTGTVTFLFTDIEGSTRLWEEKADAMRLALARHDALLRAAIETNQGHVFKTVGDAFCAVFDTAAEAVDASLSIQQTLASAQTPARSPLPPLRVRLALHTGAAEHRDGDYFGPALNRVARLLAVGHGGQVLLSEVTQGLVRDDLPPRVGLRDLGMHRLRDLQRPERVFQLTHPDLPDGFPPLRSLDLLPNNLPQQFTSFVGRETELAELRALLSPAGDAPAPRLVTLTGAGGTGKTRLALQLAADLIQGDGDGVWFVELASLAEPDLVPRGVAAALGVEEDAAKPLVRSLVEHLRVKRLLLVLDNCEHLLSACAFLAEAILRGCPDMTILATSRESLGLMGETTYRLPSLALPDPRRIASVAALSQYEAVRLFIERARAVRPTFAVTDENAPAVAQICARIDGIPLAIELAAARVQALPVEELARRLDDRFSLLTGGNRTALPRHQTLRALIDWSVALLSEPERVLLRRLSVFAGGWTLEAAETVCAGEGPEDELPNPGSRLPMGASAGTTSAAAARQDGRPMGPQSAIETSAIQDWEVLDLLTALVEKSLVVYDTAGSEARYRLLETVRQYGREQLETAGEGASLRRRHLKHFRGFAEEAGARLNGPEQRLWLERLEAEHDNLRAALEWAEALPPGPTRDESLESALLLAGALWGFWVIRGYFIEGRERLERLLRVQDSVSVPARAKALTALGWMAAWQMDLDRLGPVSDQAVQVSREAGDRRHLLFALALGVIDSALRDAHEKGRPLVREIETLAPEENDPWVLGLSLYCAAILAFSEGGHREAVALAERSRAHFGAAGDRWWLSYALGTGGYALLYLGEFGQAAGQLRESARLSLELRNRRNLAICLTALGVIARAAGETDRGLQLLGAAEALRETAGSPMLPWGVDLYRGAVEQARSTVGADAFAVYWAAGRALTLEQAVGLALEGPPAR